MGFIDAWLQGKKVYFVLVAAFVFNVGVTAGWWLPDNQVWELINTVFVFLGIGAVRSAMKKAEIK